jgi:predicted esterase
VSVAASQPGSQVVAASVYGVRYEEFDDPHEVPTEVAREALSWFVR